MGLAQALRKEPLTVYGDGKQTRSFQYVSDLVSQSTVASSNSQGAIFFAVKLRYLFLAYQKE